MEGYIFNIQNFCVHDGPGIRTTIFLKGCPLRCKWCFNPESQDIKPSFSYHKNLCIRCNSCINSCLNGALSFNESGILCNDVNKCTYCNSCIDSCEQKAIKFYGKKYTIDEVVEIVKKDMMFYESSNGGVTLSGGEVLTQFEFVSALLDRLKAEGISTLIETTAYGSFEHLSALVDKCDYVFIDIKHMDDTKHIEAIGVSNKLILDNIKKLKGTKSKVVVRIPVIPTINDGDNIIETGKFVKSLGYVERIGLLPYEKYGISKYENLNREYTLMDLNTPNKEDMKQYKTKLEELGLKVEIGI